MLPKSKRLSTEAFKEIIEKGQSIHSPFLIVRTIPKEGPSRFAVSVPKKVAKLAVTRNKIRRQVYEVIAKLSVKPGYKVVIIAKAGLDKLDYTSLTQELSKAFVKTSLLK